MDTLTHQKRQLKSWDFLSTPPFSGQENMACDLATVRRLEQHPDQSPVLRFFRWAKPTATYGKHQAWDSVSKRIPPGMDAVQRPTGGGLVMHDQDLCLSLCWCAGESPFTMKLKDHYQWIHAVILSALESVPEKRLADCRDCGTTRIPMNNRDCFTEPVGYDVMSGEKKIVGGAICRQRNIFLYQGSIQSSGDLELEKRLRLKFREALNV